MLTLCWSSPDFYDILTSLFNLFLYLFNIYFIELHSIKLRY